MAISPKCDKCGNELTENGGLAFSPPFENKSSKWHLCARCWSLFTQWLAEKPR